MPRYREPKITRWEAAAELEEAYGLGYACGLAGEPPSPADPFIRWGKWSTLKADEAERGRAAGYAEFTRRVCAVKCGELPPPVAPPKIVFDPEWQVAG